MSHMEITRFRERWKPTGTVDSLWIEKNRWGIARAIRVWGRTNQPNPASGRRLGRAVDLSSSSWQFLRHTPLRHDPSASQIQSVRGGSWVYSPPQASGPKLQPGQCSAWARQGRVGVAIASRKTDRHACTVLYDGGGHPSPSPTTSRSWRSRSNS